jgi:serine/threonine-protein kinase
VKPFEPRRFGSYILTAHLGRGGMADVYRAQRTGAAGFERTVVIKQILTPYNDDPKFVEMFVNEAKIAARLTHPNIAQVFELGEVDGEYFMALEYVRGRDLLHVLRWLSKNDGGERALPPEVAAYVAREVCRGLGHAHDHTDEDGTPRPIIHRDVSPQNIMVGYDGQVKLVDFGIAKAMRSAREETRTGALKGKIAYMAPEQIENDSPGPDSDVFSAGVVLYEMLIGRRLFKGDNDYETLKRVQTMAIPAPSRVQPSVPPELDRIVLHALERDRLERYRRASAMARELDEYLQAIRFSVEHMAEYLKETFPPEAREEIPDGRAATPEPSRSPSRAGSRPGASASEPSHHLTNPGTPRAIASQSRGGSQSGGRRTLVIAVALALVVGVGGALIAVGPLRRHLGDPEVTPEEILPNSPAPQRAVRAQVTPLPVVPVAVRPVPLDAGVAARPEPLSRDSVEAHHHADHPARRPELHPHERHPAEPKIEMFDDAPDSKSPSKKPPAQGSKPEPKAEPKIETFDD